MNASVTYERDVFVHLNGFKNVALFNRGLYYVQLQLRQERGADSEQPFLSPTGFFSCPPTLLSHVDGREMGGGPNVGCEQLAMARMEEEAFLTRAFLIRYRDEEHVLNEGCSWKTRCPPTECSRLLLHVDLFFCNIANLSPSSVTGEVAIPDDPQYSRLASQTLCVQKTSALHEIFHVRFNQQVNLEILFHCDITKFCYSDLRFGGLAATSLVDSLVTPVLANLEHVKIGLEPILTAYRALGKEESSNLNQRLEEFSAQPLDLTRLHELVCGTSLIPPTDTSTIEKELHAFIERINHECCSLVALVFSILPRICSQSLRKLSVKLQKQLQAWWQKQLVTHTIDFQGDWSSINRDEKHILDALKQSIASEKTLGRGLPVFDDDFHRHAQKAPRAAIQKYTCSSAIEPNSADEEPRIVDARSKPTDGLHLVILQHGFLGNSHDMRLLRNSLAFELASCSQKFDFLCASGNDGGEGSIQDMARKFAIECVAYVREKTLGEKKFRISLIGHSIGGLVIRRALEDSALSFLRPNLHCYISLATPHYGTTFSDSRLVSAGMRALWQYQRSPALQQLVLEDGADGEVTSSCIYSISENDSLFAFRHVIVVAALGDQYVPLHSARLQIDEKRTEKDANGRKIKTMCENVFSQIANPEKLVRVTIETGGASANLDTLIGRAQHIAYLDHSPTAMLLAHLLVPYLLSSCPRR